MANTTTDAHTRMMANILTKADTYALRALWCLNYDGLSMDLDDELDILKRWSNLAVLDEDFDHIVKYDAEEYFDRPHFAILATPNIRRTLNYEAIRNALVEAAIDRMIHESLFDGLFDGHEWVPAFMGDRFKYTED